MSEWSVFVRVVRKRGGYVAHVDLCVAICVVVLSLHYITLG